MLKCTKYQLSTSSASPAQEYDGVRHAGIYSSGELDVWKTTDEDGLSVATSTTPTANAYKYSGKELQLTGGLNSHDFHARRLPLGKSEKNAVTLLIGNFPNASHS